jgi:hypothetical protein
VLEEAIVETASTAEPPAVCVKGNAWHQHHRQCIGWHDLQGLWFTNSISSNIEVLVGKALNAAGLHGRSLPVTHRYGHLTTSIKPSLHRGRRIDLIAKRQESKQ